MTKAERIDGIIAELRSLAPAGFAAALHVTFAAPRYLFQTYDAAWMDYYSAAGVVIDDPAVRWGFANDGIAEWEALVAMDEKDVFGTARGYGLNHWAVVATSAEGSKSIAAFSRTDTPFDAAERQVILDLFTDAHCLSLTAADDPRFADYLAQLSMSLTHQGQG